MPADAQFAVGSVVFVPDEQQAYLPKRVASCTGLGARTKLTVGPLSGSGGAAVPAKDVADVVEADPLALEGAQDMVKFSNLTEAALLHNLRTRYSRDQIYSAAGAILLSVNPFKQIPGVYTDEVTRRCQEADAKALPDLPPHVYGLSENAYRGMLGEQKQQAILISGESGAGKTEAAKACVKYICARSTGGGGVGGGAKLLRQGSHEEFVQNCIVEANPILEAFGNAKTLRNNNSSRFGKWTEIHFDAGGQIRSARSTSYLLERSRVVEHARGERTYHIFYQLCAGATKQQRDALKLPPAGELRYLGQSASLSVPGIDDAADWRAVCAAFSTFQLIDAEQTSLRRVLAGILTLGNLAFDAKEMANADDGSCVSPASQASLKAAAAVLDISPLELETALTIKNVGKFPVVAVPQPPEKAAVARDALAKALYGSLFDWIFGRINEKMGAGAGAALGGGNKRTIGLLDIFGFEAFSRNSLEQLLINFANEKLMQYFNIYIFQMEEKECRDEGVACPQLQFADNSAVMVLLEAKPTGLMALIHDEVLVPNASDANLLTKMNEAHRGASMYRQMPRAQGEGFVVLHFAGEVAYAIDDFVAKSRGAVPSELSQLLGTSQLPLVRGFFAADEEGGGGGGGGGGKPKGERTMSFARHRGGGGARARLGGGGRKVVSVGRQFQESLDSLMGMLHTCSPHFVRCIKPNHHLAPDDFDGAYVMRQLQQMGMVHVVKARKQGFAHRYDFDTFIARYGYLREGVECDAAKLAPYLQTYLGSASPPAGTKTETVQLLGALAAADMFATDGWAVGTTKLFLKASHQQQLEVARESHLRRVITQTLTKAIADQDLASLDEAVARAVEIRLTGKLVEEAKALLATLREREKAFEALTEAMAARDVAAVEAALKQAAAVRLEKDAKKGAQKVSDAKVLLTQLKAQQVASNALAAALASKDVKKLRDALDAAQKSGLNSGQVTQAQRMLEGLKTKDALEKKLAAAAKGGSLAELTQLLAQAEEIGLSTEAARAAKRRHASLQESAQASSALQSASTARDEEALRAAIERASAAEQNQAAAEREKAAMSAELATAKELLAKLEAEHSTVLATPPRGGAAAARGLPTPSGPVSYVPGPPAGLPCEPLAARVARLQRGATFLKVAEGTFTRKKLDAKAVALSADRKSLTWDGGKKGHGLELSQVVRVSIGLETKPLQKLYHSSAAPDVAPTSWFSLHTAARSYDFGARDGDTAETVILWVLTLQQLVLLSSGTGGRLPATALSYAQQQWQYHNSSAKEWPCVQCTCINKPRNTSCEVCGAPKPMVTLVPTVTPLLPAMRALSNTLGIDAFNLSPDARLQWFLLKALEPPPPSPLVWSVGHRQGDGETPLLGLANADGTGFSVDHAYILSLRREAETARQQQAQAGGVLTPRPQFVAPEGPLSRENSRSLGGYELSDAEALEQAALMASLDQVGLRQGAHSYEEAHALDAGDVFRHCMSGSVEEVRRFLQQGGHADTVYKFDYGWAVGPDYLFTRPTENITLLNYVATWTDIVGEASAELARLLLNAGADPRRDDGLEQWFTPLHNAVANGAHDVVRVLLTHDAKLVDVTTGEGQSSLHLLALCDDATDRMVTLELLLGARASLNMQEPFEGGTPLHTLAREGFVAVAARLLEAGGDASIKNDAGRNALEEAKYELDRLERQTDGASSATRRAKILETINTLKMVLSVQ